MEEDEEREKTRERKRKKGGEQYTENGFIESSTPIIMLNAREILECSSSNSTPSRTHFLTSTHNDSPCQSSSMISPPEALGATNTLSTDGSPSRSSVLSLPSNIPAPTASSSFSSSAIRPTRASLPTVSVSSGVTLHHSHNHNHSQERLLVVDDVALNRKMIIRLINKRWREISEAKDGVTALYSVNEAEKERRPYHIILMDFEMPNMNGPEATKIMRSDGFEGIIIGVTGNALPEDVSYFLESGADRVILKPLDVRELMQCLADVKSSRMVKERERERERERNKSHK
eukprot:CAMPEP_0182422676 /NCGR_PEP_ID=MMETSP1167-20130531/8419_1 /TAXON_ID=2988 /ORGANISM="Mallomonas Sp, Strain CCMP3275" /LENGTH=287 /DNA_ID=CAMNT_0024600941 /DNA_START=495 /DNA_END=1358 /DNA_ORIENTATION=+